jgi:hypothetical protein
MRFVLIVAALAAGLAGAAQASPAAMQDAFFARLTALCGKAFAGRLVTTDPADKDMAVQAMVMHVRGCTATEIRIPFHVGENRSRTWVVTRTATGLRLKHDHRHEDGKPDAVTMYGGDTAMPGDPTRQEFPVDAESIALFKANALERSITNVWALEADDTIFAYELRRANRHLRVEFDLTKEVPTPLPPWGV